MLPDRIHYIANLPPKSEVCKDTVDPAEYVELNDREPCATDDPDANIISSELETGGHAPVLDIDFEARLVPSSTPGHYHLYLDGLVLEWSKYAVLLNALADAGVIERGYAEASKARQATFVRKPWVTK